jgi:hypothetical protein
MSESAGGVARRASNSDDLLCRHTYAYNTMAGSITLILIQGGFVLHLDPFSTPFNL